MLAQGLPCLASGSWEFLSCLGHCASCPLPFVLGLPRSSGRAPEAGPTTLCLLGGCYLSGGASFLSYGEQ